MNLHSISFLNHLGTIRTQRSGPQGILIEGGHRIGDGGPRCSESLVILSEIGLAFQVACAVGDKERRE